MGSDLKSKEREKERTAPFWSLEMARTRWQCQPGTRAESMEKLGKGMIDGQGESEQGNSITGQLGSRRRGSWRAKFHSSVWTG